MSDTNEGATAAGLDWLPDSVRAILLVSSRSNDDWGGVAAAEMAQMVSRSRPHVLLVNTSPGPRGPDRPLDCQNVPGLSEAMQGRRTVRDIAVAPPGRSFLFVPAGRPALPLSHLTGLPAFRHLIRAGARGGTVLLYAAETDLRPLVRGTDGAEFLGWFDGIVWLGEPGRSADLPGPAPLARVERPAASPPAEASPPHSATPRSPGRSGFSRPKRTPAIVADREKRPAAETRWARLREWVGDARRFRGAGSVIAVWLVAILSVWLIWQGLSGWPAFQDDDPTRTVERSHAESAEGAPPGAGSGAAKAESSSRAAPDGEPAGDARTATSSAPAAPEDTTASPAQLGVELPYSVLVGSYVTWGDAAERREELAADGVLSFVAPTVIAGRGRLYYRVFAGAFEDRREARAFMRDLVERGSKERDREWDMRPVRLAFALAEFETEEEAREALDRLHESGLPAYVLSRGTTSEARYQLYAGAFESEEAAAALDSILEAAGSTAALEIRRGRTR